ncbi:leucine-rich repeat extensin-like protein 2 [Clupea harengus]|uniref:Leucine-rich repeat extensin-like protein 2 n=1 Tax=Clupea harengus TaxID=7950 RepID=A0A8M1K9D3_CLUHA|nr:leucine-rich repeat extensin-like protein 2 [Clupea harengus]
MSSVSPQSPVSPYTNPGPTRTPLERHTSWVEKPVKPLSPWEAAARNPLGLVDDAFAFQGIPDAYAATHRRPLPEPPLEWKQRVSYEPVGYSPLSLQPQPQPVGYSPLSLQPQPQPVASPSRAAPFSPSMPTFYGPPFRPAQPLTANTRYQGTGSLQRKSRHSLPPLRVGRVM